MPPKSVATAPTPPAVAKTVVAPKTVIVSKDVPVGSGKEKARSVSHSDEDAWEAAQHILSAINFGSLQCQSSWKAQSNATSGSSQRSSAPEPPIMASLSADATEEDGLGRATLTDEERASLQAQLALLAAQLSEIASEDTEDDEMSDFGCCLEDQCSTMLRNKSRELRTLCGFEKT